MAAGFLAYSDSFLGAFVLDEWSHLIVRDHLHHLWPIWKVVAGTTRPVVDLTLAVNYALGGLHPFGYHLVNLAIHLAAGMVLFGVIRRTLKSSRLGPRYGEVASGLAGVTAALWVVHPLNTQAVTYVIQRAESLMGLFYLSVLYCFVRESEKPTGIWGFRAVIFCTLGMATKPMMATAPPLLLLYDRFLLSNSWKQVWEERRKIHAGLITTLLVLAIILATSQQEYRHTAGFTQQKVSPFSYALTQPGVILHYLRLSLWPHPLVFDYEWPVVKALRDALLPGLAVGGLLGLTVWTLASGWPAGFLGVWFFGVLAPSSSFIPIADCAFEYRMYLPLIAVVVGLVVGGYEVLKKAAGWGKPAQLCAKGAIILWVGIFSGMTFRRNLDYRSDVTLWRDTIRKRPYAVRAHNNLGAALGRAGNPKEAKKEFEEALRILPNDVEALTNLGRVSGTLGNLEEAKETFEQVLKIQPGNAEAHFNLGVALAKLGKLEEAKREFEETLKIQPNHPQAHASLELALEMLRKPK